MKNAKKLFLLPALAMALVTGVKAADAGTLQVPHNKNDRVIIYTKKTPYAHPVDYWWHLNPSSTGTWDYFAPVKVVDQPMPLERGITATYGTPNPSVRAKVKQAFTRRALWANPAVTGTPPAYQQGNY